ncbi:hypothetical protein [Actinoplanes regularis]|uniref:hypothetical protein n=1 Tax=Actinoplanes regularis TaxID=52697 RepID=UPI0024A42E36|nr:hypothetical protein [Actinoplanes regularis]GLW30158.1 hypothetical protein Areg01_30980 [Actinoplanes regularis]
MITTRTMERLTRQTTDHTDWCMRDHTCGVDEHRGRLIVIAPDTGGRAIVTRVRAGTVDYAEIRIRVPLRRNEPTARQQLTTALHLCRELLATVAAIRPVALARRGDRRAIGRQVA